MPPPVLSHPSRRSRLGQKETTTQTSEGDTSTFRHGNKLPSMKIKNHLTKDSSLRKTAGLSKAAGIWPYREASHGVEEAQPQPVKSVEASWQML